MLCSQPANAGTYGCQTKERSPPCFSFLAEFRNGFGESVGRSPRLWYFTFFDQFSYDIFFSLPKSSRQFANFGLVYYTVMSSKRIEEKREEKRGKRNDVTGSIATETKMNKCAKGWNMFIDKVKPSTEFRHTDDTAFNVWICSIYLCKCIWKLVVANCETYVIPM